MKYCPLSYAKTEKSILFYVEWVMENRRVSIMVVIGLSRGLFRANKKNDNYERVTIILLGRCLSRFVTTFKQP